VVVAEVAPAPVQGLAGLPRHWAAADDGVDNLCQHGMRPPIFFQAWGLCWVGVGLSGVTERHICEGSRARGTDRLLIKPTGGQAGAGTAGNRSDERHTLPRPDR
jgi:hypothetical protein